MKDLTEISVNEGGLILAHGFRDIVVDIMVPEWSDDWWHTCSQEVPTSANPLSKLSHRHGQRLVSYVNLDPGQIDNQY